MIALSGIAFAGTQFVVSNVLGPELADLLAALITVVAVVGLLCVLAPFERVALRKRAGGRRARELRDPTPRAHALRLVAVHHHRRAVPVGAGAPHQGRRQQHPDRRKLPFGGVGPDDRVTRRAVARARRAGQTTTPCLTGSRPLTQPL